MIWFHLFYDLDYFGILPLDHKLYAETVVVVPILFISIVGVSLSLSSAKGILRNSLLILACALYLSLLSFEILPKQPIYFGILHCIAISMLLCIPLLKVNPKILFVGSLVILVSGFIISFNILEVNVVTYALGIHNQQITSIDYFPLLPWFGYTLLGLSIGKILYKDHERQFALPKIFQKKNLLVVPGRHSLAFYLAHQPIIVVILKTAVYLKII
jgi:uncharacterized membrane protein